MVFSIYHKLFSNLLLFLKNFVDVVFAMFYSSKGLDA